MEAPLIGVTTTPAVSQAIRLPSWATRRSAIHQLYVTNPIMKDSYMPSTWAAHNGDMTAVPVPAATWLFGSALVGLAGVSRRRK